MGNFLSSVMTYAEPWVIVNRESFDTEDKAQIESAKVIRSKEFGNLSVALYMKNGGFKPVPLDKGAQTLAEGTMLNVDNLELLTLKRGDETCYKIHVK